MNLMLSQMTQLPVASEPNASTPPSAIAGASGISRTDAADASGGLPEVPAFNDALLNVINTLTGGEHPRDETMVLAGLDTDDDKEQQADAPVTAADLMTSPQQLLDALLMASQMPVKTLSVAQSATPQSADALTIHSLSSGRQPAAASPLKPLLQTPAAPPGVSSEPAGEALKPAMTDTLKALTSAMPAVGQSPLTASQSLPTAVDKPTVNLPPLRLDADENKWAQQLHSALSDRLQLQVRNQLQHATIRLDPPEMGKVDISLQIENGRMQVHINASNGETYRALQQISNELRQSLTEQNFVQVNVQVSSHSGQSQQGRGQQQMNTPQESPIAGADIVAEDARATVNKDDSVLLTV